MWKENLIDNPQDGKKSNTPQLHRSGISTMLFEAIQQRLSAIGKAIVINEEGGLDFVDSEELTPLELIDAAWSDGLIRIAPNGDILLLVAVRVKTDWDKSRIRRRLEDKIRKEWSLGDILVLATAIGIQIK